MSLGDRLNSPNSTAGLPTCARGGGYLLVNGVAEQGKSSLLAQSITQPTMACFLGLKPGPRRAGRAATAASRAALSRAISIKRQLVDCLITV